MFNSCKYGWVGFDVGAASVKAAQLVRKNGDYLLRTAAIVPRRQRWDAEALSAPTPRPSADELSAAAALCDRLTRSPAATMLPVAACEVLQMNAVANKRGGGTPDLARAVEAETQNSMRERVLDSWQVDAEGRKLNVITAPKSWSDQLSAEVTATGRRCRVVDALPWALARAARLVHDAGDDEAKSAFVALDWGYSRTTLVLVDRGVPAYVRVLRDCGYENVLAAVQRELRLDQRDAEMILTRHGFDDGEATNGRCASAIGAILGEPFDRLLAEIRRTFGYWQGLTRGLSPDRVYLFGGGGALRGAERRLSDGLGVDAIGWRLPFECATDAGALQPACLFGAAAGLSALAWEST